jgi:hypothetical protein
MSRRGHRVLTATVSINIVAANESRENRCESLTFDPKNFGTLGGRPPLIFTFFYSADEYSRFGEYDGGRSSRSRDINRF